MCENNSGKVASIELDYEVFRAKVRVAQECPRRERTPEQNQLLSFIENGPSYNSLFGSPHTKKRAEQVDIKECMRHSGWADCATSMDRCKHLWESAIGGWGEGRFDKYTCVGFELTIHNDVGYEATFYFEMEIHETHRLGAMGHAEDGNVEYSDDTARHQNAPVAICLAYLKAFDISAESQRIIKIMEDQE